MSERLSNHRLCSTSIIDYLLVLMAFQFFQARSKIYIELLSLLN